MPDTATITTPKHKKTFFYFYDSYVCTLWGSFFRGSAATMPWGDMLFVGWPRERLSELIPMHGKKLVGFAGAAFSGFSLLPVIASALYGAGKLGITGDPAQELQSTCDPKTVTRVDNEDAGKEEKGPTSKDKKDKGKAASEEDEGSEEHQHSSSSSSD